jgi:hypothetical protein
MRTLKRITILAVLVLAGISLAVSFTACAPTKLTAFVTGKGTYRLSAWTILADTSGSTATQTKPGGVYEHEIMAALETAARMQATVYASAVDGNAIADGSWEINRVELRSTRTSNAKLAERARARKARHLRGQVQHLLASRPTSGSDLLGGLQDVARFGRSLPKGLPKTLVLLTDGALNLSRFGGYDIYTNPPDAPDMRRRLIARFKREGELPNLSGWKVYLGGIGVGIGDRATARAVLELWEALIPATGATLVQINSTLAFG